MKKVTHLPSKCIGCMACVGLAPHLFEADNSNGLSKLIKGQADGENFSRQVENDQVPEILVSACCGGAIEVEDIND